MICDHFERSETMEDKTRDLGSSSFTLDKTDHENEDGKNKILEEIIKSLSVDIIDQTKKSLGIELNPEQFSNAVELEETSTQLPQYLLPSILKQPSNSTTFSMFLPRVQYPGSNIPKLKKVQRCIHIHSKQEPKHSVLHRYIESLLHGEAQYPCSIEANHIIETMVSMCGTMCKRLNNYHSLFKNCYFLETGSIFEGLKVNMPDEFDFMIILPELSDEGIIKFRPSDRMYLIEYDVIDEAVFKIKDGVTHENIYNHFDELLEEILRDILPSGWTLSNDLLGRILLSERIAHTFKITYNGGGRSSFDIDVDFCFSIPLYQVPSWKTGNAVLKTVQEAIFLESPFPMFYIFRSNNCRLSFSVYEKAIVNQYENDKAPKSLLRLAKVLRSTFIPKKYDDNTRSMTSLVSTYWLKNVFYEELSVKNSEECWETVDIAFELIMFFKKLRSCLNDGKMLSFFIPHYNLFSETIDGSTTVNFTLGASNFLQPTKEREKEQLIKSLDKLINILELLYENKADINILYALQKDMQEINNKEFFNNLKEALFMMLYYFAYNGGDDEEGYATIQTFITRYLPYFSMTGTGYDIVLKENGKIVNIDQCLMDIYKSNDDGKPFDYFPLSR